jgi:hypothetical protein
MVKMERNLLGTLGPEERYGGDFLGFSFYLIYPTSGFKKPRNPKMSKVQI